MNIGQYSFAEFKKLAASFHGYPAPGLLIGGYMVELAKSRLPRDILFDAVVETSKCLPDAVQLLTLCSIGNGWMRIVNLGRYALALYDKFTGHGIRVYVDLAKMDNYPEIKGWFLKLKPKAEQDTEALFAEIEEAGDAYLGWQKIVVSNHLLRKKKMEAMAICPVCSESYPVSDGAICRGCQGDGPYLHENRQESDQDRKVHISSLKAIPVEQAIGKQLLHDLTGIVPGKSKGAEFKAGHQISVGDICRLQQIGKLSVYTADQAPDSPDLIHENDAVLAFAREMAGPGVSYQDSPEEGKINFSAQYKGLLDIDLTMLEQFNLIPDVMCASRQANVVVDQGKPFAGTRAIPLYLERRHFTRAMQILEQGPLFSVLPLRALKVGILVTGTEVFQGLIKDKFYPIIKTKVENFSCPVLAYEIVPDQKEAIRRAVEKIQSQGCELLVTTAGLSVDPDDVTRKALLGCGLDNCLYGAPILPGAMTLLGQISRMQVMGVPACALFYKTTSFDLLLPRILAGQKISRADLSRLASGAYCLNCQTCTFPKCPFGK